MGSWLLKLLSSDMKTKTYKCIQKDRQCALPVITNMVTFELGYMMSHYTLLVPKSGAQQAKEVS